MEDMSETTKYETLLKSTFQREDIKSRSEFSCLNAKPRLTNQYQSTLAYNGSSFLMSQISEQLYNAVKSNETKLISNLLNSELTESQNDSQSFMILKEIIDIKGNSLLHHAAINNNACAFQDIINAFQKQKNQSFKDIQALHHFIDLRNAQGYAAFHLACYRGNLEIVQLVHKIGGDLTLLSSQGLSGIHIASQCNQVVLLVYLHKTLNQSLDQLDYSKGTPLHQASFFGSEKAAFFLISWGASLNIQDKEGFTPLHLAAISGFPKIAKRLVYHGANKSLLDSKGNTPFQVALENQFASMAENLQVNSKINFLSCFSFRVGRLRKSKQQLYLFFILYFLNMAFSLLFVTRKNLQGYAFLGYSFVQFIMLIWLYRSNPGFLPTFSGNVENLMEMIQKYGQDQICPECQNLKPKRSKHCDLCERCVCVYDHHCPWINNCIGAKNHFKFLVFIVGLFLLIAWQTTQIIIEITKKETSESLYLVPQMINQKLFDQIQFYGGITFASTCGLFLFPLLILVIVQAGNFMMNKTTYERFSASSELQSPKESCFVNCNQMCYLNKNRKSFQFSTEETLLI